MFYRLSDSFVLIGSDGANHFRGMTDYHYHDQIELYFLTHGECSYLIGNKIYPVNAGQLVLIPSGMIHKTSYRTKIRSRIILSVKKDFIDFSVFQRTVDVAKPGIFIFPQTETRALMEIFSEIEKELKRLDEFSAPMCQYLCFSLFTLLARSGRNVAPDIQKAKGPDNENAVVEAITKRITEHYAEEITLSGVAADAAISEGYLSKLFKRVTGMGFKEYLITVRIYNAKLLLKNSTKSVSEIAFACGFNDSNYFSKMFRERAGCTPLQYRKEHRQI